MSVLCVVGIRIITRLHDVVYMVRWESVTILRFNATTRQLLTNIDIKGLRMLRDIVACERTSQLYVADNLECVWRMSSDGTDIKHWLPKSPDDTFKPRKLSVTSTRLLVTSRDTRQLIQFEASGEELNRVQLPYNMLPHHAVESPTGTFIVSLSNRRLWMCQVVEINSKDKVLRQFSGSNLPTLGITPHVAVDSHGNIFVTDVDNGHVLLLDDHLLLRRVIIDEHQLNYKPPRRLCYREESGQLMVALEYIVAVFDVLRP